MSDVDTALATLRTARDEKRRELVALAERTDAAKADERRLSRAIAVLDPTVGEATAEPNFADLALKAFTETGTPLSQAEVHQSLGGPRSRANYALQALVKKGVIVRTDETKDRSPVFALAES